jgi:hypothetical protein
MEPELIVIAKAIIESRSEAIPIAGCWIWLGGMSKGYGVWPLAWKERRAHRVSYAAYNGPLLGELIRHTCDVACCVNPAHLIIGNSAENQRDKAVRGRSARGEKNGRAKLTEQQVLAIRADFAKGGRIADLAQVYHLDYATIRDIVYHTTWRHI